MKAWRVALSVCVVAYSSPTWAVDKAACLKAYEDAQRHTQATELTRAHDALLVCADSSCPEALRKDCTTWLGEVEKSLPTVVFEVRSGGREVEDVEVSVDGHELASELAGKAHPVDPGRHLFRFEAPGHPAVEKTITIHQGEKNRAIAVEIPAAPPLERHEAHAGPSPLVFVLAGVGAVGLVSFSYFGIQGLSGRSDLDACKGHCAQSDVDAVHANFTRADVSLAVATVALGGAAWFYFHGRSEPGDARVGLVTRPSSISTTVDVAF